MVLTLNLNPDEARRLADIATRDGRSINDVAREAVEQYIDEDTDDQRWAAEVAAEWEASDQRTRPLSELRTELDL